MKTVLASVVCIAAILTATPTGAQRRQPAAQKPGGNITVPESLQVYLGSSTLIGGPIPKAVFDSLASQGLRAMDKSGVQFKVRGFQFNYAERGVYEDSVGNPIVLVDHLSDYCPGDTLPPYIRYSIHERTKAGDTVLFDRIRVTAADGGELSARALQFVITP